MHCQRRNQRITSRAVRRCRCCGRRLIPHNAQPPTLHIPTPPYTFRIPFNARFDLPLWPHHLQSPQVPHEDAFELRSVFAEIWLPMFVEDGVLVCELAQSGERDAFGRVEVGRVGSSGVEFDEGAKDDALIVRPDNPAIVATRRGINPIIYIALSIHHARSPKPLPLLQRPLDIVFLFRSPVCKMCCKREEEFIFDGAGVFVTLVPPDSTAWAPPPADHIFKDAHGHLQVFLLVRQIVDAQPGEGPPSFVVVKVVQESGTLRLGLLKGVGQDG